MHKVVNVKRGEANQWKQCKKQCEKEMRTWIEDNVDENNHLEQLCMSWNTAYRRAVDRSIDWRKRGVTGRKRGCKWDAKASVMRKVMIKVTR